MTSRTPPITGYAKRIVAGLKRVAASDTPRLTFGRLIDVMGSSAHRLLILMLTLLNMIPGPPGFGGTIAWTILAVAIAMVLGRPIRLPGIIARRRLPLHALLKASEQVVKVAAMIARFSKLRLTWLTGAAATIPYGIFTMVVSAAMAVPIPFINAVPNVGLCILAFSMLNRDGLGATLGVVVALLGLGIEALLLLGAFQLGMAAIGSMA